MENGNESPTETERKKEIINEPFPEPLSEIPISDPITACDQSPDDSLNNNEIKTEISGLSKGHLSIDHVPSVDESANSSPRSHDDIPVGTVFAFENHQTSKTTPPRDRKKSRDSNFDAVFFKDRPSLIPQI